MKTTRTENEPHDNLTELANEIIDRAPENYRVIVMIFDGNRGGIGIHGYEKDSEAMADIFVHLAAVFEANGKKLIVAPLGEG